MYYVYLLKSLIDKERTYVGFTTDIDTRLYDHNNGKSVHTARYKPWKLHAYFAFEDKDIALNVERYLKTASGRSLSKKHFW